MVYGRISNVSGMRTVLSEAVLSRLRSVHATEREADAELDVPWSWRSCTNIRHRAGSSLFGTSPVSTRPDSHF